MISNQLKMLTYKLFVYIYSFIYLIYMYEQELALNNLQGLICHETQSN